MGGVQLGFRHYWNYTENKYKQKGKRFTIEQSKRRNKPAPKGSGMKIKSKLIWNIRGMEKIGKPRYVKGKGYLTPVIIKGIKRQQGFKLPQMKKFRISKRKKYVERRSKW